MCTCRNSWGNFEGGARAWRSVNVQEVILLTGMDGAMLKRTKQKSATYMLLDLRSYETVQTIQDNEKLIQECSKLMDKYNSDFCSVILVKNNNIPYVLAVASVSVRGSTD